MIKYVLETKRRRRKLDLAKMMHVFVDSGACRVGLVSGSSSDDTVSHSEPDDDETPINLLLVRLLN